MTHAYIIAIFSHSRGRWLPDTVRESRRTAYERRDQLRAQGHDARVRKFILDPKEPAL